MCWRTERPQPDRRCGSSSAKTPAAIKPHPLRNCGSLRPKFSPNNLSTYLISSFVGMHMTNRTMKFASAILISALAGTLLAVEATPLHATETCLSGPKGGAPNGSHWFYRIDHATKRNCWYVRAEGGKAVSASAAGTQASAPHAQPLLQRSVANARAEASPADTGQSAAGAAKTVPLISKDNSQSLNPPTTGNAPAAVATRWVDQTATVDASPLQSDDSGATQKSSTQPAAAAPLAAPARRSASPSVLTLVLVLIGALASAGIFGSAIFRSGRARRNDPHDSGPRSTGPLGLHRRWRIDSISVLGDEGSGAADR